MRTIKEMEDDLRELANLTDDELAEGSLASVATSRKGTKNPTRLRVGEPGRLDQARSRTSPATGRETARRSRP
jgi:hypothetical protein